MPKIGMYFDRMLDILALVTCVLLAIVVLFTGIDIVLRNMLNRSLGWVFEIAEYSVLAITFLCAAWVLRNEEHVKIELVLSRLNPATQAWLKGVTSSLGAITCLVVAWYGGQLTWDYFQSGYYYYTFLECPQYPILAIAVVGVFLLFIQFLRRTYGSLASRRVSR